MQPATRLDAIPLDVIKHLLLPVIAYANREDPITPELAERLEADLSLGVEMQAQDLVTACLMEVRAKAKVSFERGVYTTRHAFPSFADAAEDDRRRVVSARAAEILRRKRWEVVHTTEHYATFDSYFIFKDQVSVPMGFGPTIVQVAVPHYVIEWGPQKMFREH